MTRPRLIGYLLKKRYRDLVVEVMRWLVDRIFSTIMGLAFISAQWIVRLFPRRLLLRLFEVLADVGFYLFRGFRRRSIYNLSVALGDRLNPRERAETAQKSLRNFFRDFVEVAYALQAAPEAIQREIPLLGREHLEKALAKGKGVIALSAHLGNFFLIGTRLAIEGYPTHVLVKPARNGHFMALMDRYRLMIGQKTIHARPRRKATRELIQILRRNEIAVVIADEHRSSAGISVSFFGQTVLARRGPITLTLRTGAALVPVYMIRDPSGQLKLVVEPELELSWSGRPMENVAKNTLRLTQWLEQVVRSYPDQWNWMNIRWQEASTPARARKGERG